MQFVDNITPSLGDYQHQDPWNALPFKDWANYKDWLQMYVPNAFNAAMLNYQNEYNRPINQMLRYQEAGINPYAVVGNISASSAEAKPGQASSYGGTAQWQKSVQNMISSLSTTAQMVGTAKEIYDYLKFGKDISFSNKAIAQYNADIAGQRATQEGIKTAWERYWSTGEDSYIPGTDKLVSESPRAQYMELSTNEKLAHIGQLQALVNTLYPEQAAAARANAALNDYKLSIARGQNDAVLNIDTGDKKTDSVLMLLSYWLLGIKPSIGISAKL